ncbi:poly(A)-specific ribonuclease PARN-like isoform X2 [Bacillus rossius redtenbacheri]|uniref:poly(A)-specific ribonuclease PARN-like isoform X2 n=1 Tax=Bacillus rossius redtenbacheri TaxID=93214 RepID=UPI002FDDDC44
MEVTRSNLEELLPEIERAVAEAQFLAVDGEFTGLREGQSVFPHDSPARQYAKLLRGMDFLLVQFGLCAFQYHPGEDRYTHRAYNFYVFPRQLSRSSADPRFLCQSSCINFLATHGFDFNKLFRDGIPYMTQSEEQRQREELREQERQLGSPQRGEPVPVPDNLQDTVSGLCAQVQDFLSGDSPERRLPTCSGFVRKLLHQEVERRYPGGEVVLEARQTEAGERVLVALRAGGAAERRRLLEEAQARRRAELDRALGFSRVLRLVSRSGKLVVGHNMLLDVSHSLHQFVDPLPPDYLQFKEMVGFVFPRLLDTKLMSASPPFKDRIAVNALQSLYDSLCDEPFSMPQVGVAEEGAGYTARDDKGHEAAYDAFLTGLCYLAMARHLGSQDSPPTHPVLPTSPLLAPYINKLNLLRSVDSNYIDLSGDDPEVPTAHVFYLSFPREWKTSDVAELFSPFGGVQLSWVSDTSAWVALRRRDQARLVAATLSQSDRYALVSHAAHRRHEELCGCATLSARDMALCLRKRSPSPAVLKRRAREPVPAAGTPKRRCSRGFREGSVSKRGFDPIAEERSEEQEASPCSGAAGGGCVPSGSAPAAARTKQFAECDSWD